jgi:hypothetical protein
MKAVVRIRPTAPARRCWRNKSYVAGVLRLRETRPLADLVTLSEVPFVIVGRVVVDSWSWLGWAVSARL